MFIRSNNQVNHEVNPLHIYKASALAKLYEEEYHQSLTTLLNDVDAERYSWWERLQEIPTVKVLLYINKDKSSPDNLLIQVSGNDSNMIEDKETPANDELKERVVSILQLVYPSYLEDKIVGKLYKEIYGGEKKLRKLVKLYGCNDIGDYIMCHLSEQVMFEYTTEETLLFAYRSAPKMVIDNAAAQQPKETKPACLPTSANTPIDNNKILQKICEIFDNAQQANDDPLIIPYLLTATAFGRKWEVAYGESIETLGGDQWWKYLNELTVEKFGYCYLTKENGNGKILFVWMKQSELIPIRFTTSCYVITAIYLSTWCQPG